MLHVALLEPEIAQNVGNIARSCAAVGAELHLIRPLGFRLGDPGVRRAGMDYLEEVTVHVHAGYPAFEAALAPAFAAGRVFALSTKGEQRYSGARYRAGDVLLFGPESRGLPPAVLAHARALRLPMRPGVRSLNLAVAVGVCLYEAWRQLDFAGGI